jgi:hypothetical protein
MTITNLFIISATAIVLDLFFWVSFVALLKSVLTTSHCFVLLVFYWRLFYGSISVFVPVATKVLVLETQCFRARFIFAFLLFPSN